MGEGIDESDDTRVVRDGELGAVAIKTSWKVSCLIHPDCPGMRMLVVGRDKVTGESTESAKTRTYTEPR